MSYMHVVLPFVRSSFIPFLWNLSPLLSSSVFNAEVGGQGISNKSSDTYDGAQVARWH